MRLFAIYLQSELIPWLKGFLQSIHNIVHLCSSIDYVEECSHLSTFSRVLSDFIARARRVAYLALYTQNPMTISGMPLTRESSASSCLAVRVSGLAVRG